jgi:Recombinase
MAGKKAADARARALLPIIRELMAAGFIARQALADELNRRKIPTARGRRWQYTTVLRMLTRLGLLVSGKGGRINNGQESKRAADARAKELASTIRKLQSKGFVSSNAIAQELNAREITPDEGQAVASILEAKRRAIETVDLEARLSALEAERNQ